MGNSTQFTTIILVGYIDVGCVTYLYFTILLLIYIAIILANSLLIGVICVERSLQEPMYIFLCNMSVNELYGSAAFFPSILTNMLSKSHQVTIIHCYVQIFSLYTYASVEFGNLAIMSYDRYTAICYPLLYSSIMTRNRVFILIALVWLISFVKFSGNLILNLRSELCGNVIEKVWCDNYMLVKLACSDTTVNNIYGITGSVLTIVLPLMLIGYSYLKILRACLKCPASDTQKMMATCIPHLVSLLNFSLGCSFEIFSSRFEKLYMPSVLRVIISVYFVICPPLLNPIMYGIRLSKIKVACKKKIFSLK
ncbi:olfactory receptor 142-like [Electrophorus electricus]|uniref:Olfactory receptor n=1 Tax=Electrophorus electricus TaxID=8005 RepID=A0A4W4HMV8_ELEEL|nr:olfactory receptor 142-like [Electrophorus electricus]